jgi:hypothetical protein
MQGDKFCIICGQWLGNFNTGETPEGQASYYSIIRRKYCPTCNQWKRAQDVCFNMKQYRKRKKALAKLKEDRLQLYADENKALREYVIRLRDQLERK